MIISTTTEVSIYVTQATHGPSDVYDLPVDIPSGMVKPCPYRCQVAALRLRSTFPALARLDA